MTGTVGARPLLNTREQILYGRLMRAFPGHVILVNVALSRVVVGAFVVCKSDFTPLAVFELDEAPRLPSSRSERHRRKDQSLQAAGIKMIRLPAADVPNELALKALMAALPLNSSTDQLVRRAS